MSNASVRPMVPTDLEMVLEWRNYPDIRRHMFTQNEISFNEHRCWFEQNAKDPSRHLLIFELDNEPLGFIHFSQLSEGGIADWGFYTAPASPKGCGYLLGYTALNHAFIQLGLYKICGRAINENERSIGLHQRLGFQQEGILRDQHFDGEHYRSVVCFGLLRCEWPPYRED